MPTKLLIVEDDPFLIELYAQKFFDAGFAVEAAADGEAALSNLEKEEPSLMLLDLTLPKIHGLEVLKILRKSEKWRHLPVVIVTNRQEHEFKEKARQLGAIDYLVKSFYTPTELVARVKEILEKNK